MSKTHTHFYLHGSPATSTSRKAQKVEHNRLSRRYDRVFKATKEYRATLPDLMAAPKAVEGAEVHLPQVGIARFRLPLRVKTRDGGVRTLEAKVSGTVSLEAQLKGINMSRLVRAMSAEEAKPFTFARLEGWLKRFRREAGSFEARVRVEVSYPIRQRALRSGLSGWQFYRLVFAGELAKNGEIRRRMEFDFQYSSTCPCSAELAEHARAERGQYAVPHSQRSRARLWVELARGAKLVPEDLQRHCIQALNTETQVMVRREDEQAFGELNGAYLKFVEDAARLLYGRLSGDRRIADYRIACAHFESLHNHDAVAVVSKGVRGGYLPECDWEGWSGN